MARRSRLPSIGTTINKRCAGSRGQPRRCPSACPRRQTGSARKHVVTRRRAAKVAMPSGVPVGMTSRAPRRCRRSHHRWSSRTGRSGLQPTALRGQIRVQTVHSGRSSPGVSSRLRQSPLPRGTALPAALRPAHGLRADTFGSLSCVAQLGARGCTDRSIGRSRECCWHEGATVLRTAPLGRCGSADFSAGKYGDHAMATNPAWDWASHTQARPRYTEPGRVRPAGSLCTRNCVTQGRITR
jgi:hypothetical protein